MKLTKARLQQIIKEEIDAVREGNKIPSSFDIPASGYEFDKPRKGPMTEYELYAHFSPIVKRLQAFVDDMNYAAGLTASSMDTLELPEELHNEINRAVFKLEKLRIKMAQTIGQDPHPEMRS